MQASMCESMHAIVCVYVSKCVCVSAFSSFTLGTTENSKHETCCSVCLLLSTRAVRIWICALHTQLSRSSARRRCLSLSDSLASVERNKIDAAQGTLCSYYSCSCCYCCCCCSSWFFYRYPKQLCESLLFAAYAADTQ